LFFRDQAFGPQRLVDVARVFGEPYKQNRYSHELDGFPDIEVLENSDTRQQKADVWHADVTWQPNPPKATILQAQDLPAEGGEPVQSLRRVALACRPAHRRCSATIVHPL
jgi:taurine dioxygenase